MTALPRALAPLRLHRYRLLAASMALSLLAAGLWAVAVVWQVVALGGGPAALSSVTALGAGGMLASTLLGGALADRIPQRRILLTTELVQGGTVALVAGLSLSGALALWHLAAVALVGGLAMGLYYPAYSALVPALVPEGDLLAVNGLEGMVRPVLQSAAGPAIAGFLVASFSPGAALVATAAPSCSPRRACGRCRLPRAAVIRRPSARPPPACWRTAARGSSTWSARRGCWPGWCSPRSCCWCSSARSRSWSRSPSRTAGAGPPSRPTSWPRSASAGRSAHSSSPPPPPPPPSPPAFNLSGGSGACPPGGFCPPPPSR